VRGAAVEFVRLLATAHSIHATASSAVAAAFARSRAVSSTVVRGGVMVGWRADATRCE
jgi:hypothetical protein